MSPTAGSAAARSDLPAAGLAQLGGAVVLLGGAWPVTKLAIAAGADALWFAEGRATLSALATFAALAAFGRLRLPGRADLPALLAVGLFQLAGFFALAHAAVRYVPAGRTVILVNTTPLFVVPLSLLVLHEAIPPRRWVAVVLGLAGVVAMTGPWAIDWAAPGVLLGHAFLLGAAGAWSVAIIAVRRFPPRLSMLEILPWCFALGAAALLPIAWQHDPGRWTAPALGLLGFIGVAAGPLGTWCVMQAALTLPAIVASIGFLSTPVVGLLIAALWLGERIDAGLAIGSALIVGGVGIAAWPRRGPRGTRRA